MGVAIGTWGGGGRGPAPAHCEIASDGSVVMRIGTQDIGTGTRTLVAMVTADALGLQPAQITPEIGDTLYGVSAGLGRQHDRRPASVPAIRIAALKALDALKEKVAPALGVDAASLVAAGGRIHVKDNPSQGHVVGGRLQADRPAADHRGRRLGSPACRRSTTCGAQFAEVTVDVETGIVKVTRVLAIQDCGLVVSRLTAESQCLRRRHRLAELRAVRGSHPRPQHRADGQPEHGVVPARRHVGHPADRRPAEGSAGARRRSASASRRRCRRRRRSRSRSATRSA